MQTEKIVQFLNEFSKENVYGHVKENGKIVKVSKSTWIDDVNKGAEVMSAEKGFNELKELLGIVSQKITEVTLLMIEDKSASNANGDK